MGLERTLRRKTLVLLGLNSGTSADGLDMAAVKIGRTGPSCATRFLTGTLKAYPAPLRNLVLQAADSRTIDLDTVICLDNALGHFYGRTAAVYIRKLVQKGIHVDVIASHGQTVRHLPRKVRVAGYVVNGTLQLGSPDRIAVATRKPVIADFRQADVALGHEGAPITTGAMERLFASAHESRLIVNIGGIANYFYFPAPRSGFKPDAADCGPGNSLSDILTQRLYSHTFDRNGARGSRGTVSPRLLSLLLKSSFLSDTSASTGREEFGSSMAERIITFGRRHRLPPEDLLATVIELTAAAIAATVRPKFRRDRRLSKLYLTGGGRRNKFLVSRLSEQLGGVEVRLADKLGIDADCIEAAAYAVLGEACLRSEPLHVTGGRRGATASPILGHLVQPPVMRAAGAA